NVTAQAEAAQNLAFGTIDSVARGLAKLTSDEFAQVETDPAGLRALLGQKGVPLASDPEPFIVAAAADFNAMTAASQLAMAIAAIVISLVGLAYAYRMIAPRFRARNKVEQVILAGLITASCIAILTTVGIVASMLTETI